MNKIIGYAIAAVGLFVLALPFIKVIPIPEQIKPAYTMIGGIAIIIAGIALTLGPKTSKVEKEVPIYEGEGKHRKVVGYQRMSKK
ncbi:MAG: hypothetical protein KKE50_01610 [Nanoarchaeota archaeon]|nr:hypothetical protein [Nanoarchaeota archaeon]